MATTENRPASGAALDTRELLAWRGLLRTQAWLTKALDAELDITHGLPLSSYEVLMHLGDADDHRMRMCDLASSILLSRSGLTRLVDRLERDGFIERVSCQDDARGAFARLTPAGEEKLAAARATHRAGVRSLFLDHLSPDEQEMLGGLWERIVPGGVSGPPPKCCSPEQKT